MFYLDGIYFIPFIACFSGLRARRYPADRIVVTLVALNFPRFLVNKVLVDTR